MSHHKREQGWMVISSVTLVCASLQLMITQQQQIQIQMSLYRGQSYDIPSWNFRQYSLFYLFLIPIYLYFINKYSIKIIKQAAYYVILSSLIKFMTGNSYHLNYANNLVLNLLNPLVLLLPFSLLSNFSNQNRLLAPLIPLFIPKVVTNLLDLFKHKYIVGAFALSHGGTYYYIQQLSAFTTLLAIVSGTIAGALVKINESNKQKQQIEDRMSSIQIKQMKHSVLILILWGIIIGCEKIFSKCLYSYYKGQTRTSQLIVIDIVIDLLSLLASYQILRLLSLQLKSQLILFINIIGVFGLILCQATLHSQFSYSKALIVLSLVMIRVGLLSFASPATSQFSPSIVTAAILIYTARVMEQLFQFYKGNPDRQYSHLPNIAMVTIISLIFTQIIRQWSYIMPKGYNKKENIYFQL